MNESVRGSESSPSAEGKPMQKCGTMRRMVNDFAATLGDAHVREMFLNCFFSSLDTAAEWKSDGSVFMLTGDIPAMWLRDSAVQVTGYLPYAAADDDVRALIRGVLARQFFYINIDPYANAFNEEANGRGHKDDVTDFDSPWVWERKFEIDSLCYPLWLAQQYVEQTGDYTVYDATFQAAYGRILDTFETEQDHFGRSSYRHSRPKYPQFPTLQNEGRGAPVGYTGMIWSGYRPSDDVCEYGYLIPSNMFACTVLEWLLGHAEKTGISEEACLRTRKLCREIEQGIAQYAVYEHPKYGKIYAYEVDGLGNRLLCDDANVPNLLGLPYIGYCAKNDPIYRNTRAFVLSGDDPYFFSGAAARGLGSPHTPDRYIWHIGIIMQLLTSACAEERAECFRYLLTTDAGCGCMHEGFDCDDPAKFTRPWFCWANTLFARAVTEMKERGEIQ